MATRSWPGQERRSGRDRRTMPGERPEQERRVAERRGAARPEDAWPRAGARPTNPEKDPEDWVTGDEPMTGAQRSYLDKLARETGETVPDNLTKADASRLIDELQARRGRGANPSDGIG
jgi:hypothetical protein